MKHGKVLVRVIAPSEKLKEAFLMAESVVNLLDNGEWDGRKTVTIK